MLVCNVNSLMAEASCFICLSDTELLAAKVRLREEIYVNAVGGSERSISTLMKDSVAWQKLSPHQRLAIDVAILNNNAMTATGLKLKIACYCAPQTELLAILAYLDCAFASNPETSAASTLCVSSVNLGIAETYGTLGGTTVTNTGATIVSGDLGLSPGTDVVGFPPGVVINGEQHITDAEAAAAQVSLTAAYVALAALPGATTVAGNIGGQTLLPGLYKSTSTLAVSSGDLILDGMGDPCAEFLFQIGSTLTMGTGRKIILVNGAKASNVFWQVGSSATLGANSVFNGSILALTAITLVTEAAVTGRLLARNAAVTLDTNSVVVP